jgi:hypothetical protein
MKAGRRLRARRVLVRSLPGPVLGLVSPVRGRDSFQMQAAAVMGG